MWCDWERVQCIALWILDKCCINQSIIIITLATDLLSWSTATVSQPLLPLWPSWWSFTSLCMWCLACGRLCRGTGLQNLCSPSQWAHTLFATHCTNTLLPVAGTWLTVFHWPQSQGTVSSKSTTCMEVAEVSTTTGLSAVVATFSGNFHCFPRSTLVSQRKRSWQQLVFLP